LTTPIQLYGLEVSYTKTMEKKLKRRLEEEGKEEVEEKTMS
jgi:hypothetical protein